MTTKSKPELGFELGDLEAQTERYERTPPSPGRPRILAQETQPISIRVDTEQRRWLLQEAARRTLASGERHDMSRIVRELIDQSRGVSG